MQARLALRQELDPLLSFFRVRYQSRHYDGVTHLGLLVPLPAIRMCDHVVDIVFEGRPEVLAIDMGILDIVLCAIV